MSKTFPEFLLYSVEFRSRRTSFRKFSEFWQTSKTRNHFRSGLKVSVNTVLGLLLYDDRLYLKVGALGQVKKIGGLVMHKPVMNTFAYVM